MQVAITGIIRFITGNTPEVHPNFPDADPKFRFQFNVPKESVELGALMEAVKQTALSKWGAGTDAKKRIKAIERTIMEGDNDGPIGLLDGDEFKPEYNKGQMVVKASAKNTAKPRYRDVGGDVMERAPEPGDLVRVLIDVWAMAQHKRINFTVLGTRMVQKGFAEVGGAPQLDEGAIDEALDEPSEETLALFGDSAGPALPAGDVDEPDEEEEKPKRKKRGRPRKKAAAKKVDAEVVDDEEEEEDAAPSGGLFDGL